MNKLSQKNIVFVGAAGLVLFLLMVFVYSGGRVKTSLPVEKGVALKDIGISVGGADQQAYLARLEKNYYDFEDRVKGVEVQIKNLQNLAGQLDISQKQMAQSVLKISQGISVQIDQKLDQFKDVLDSANNPLKARAQGQDFQLSLADIHPAGEDNWVYLPIGSFCQGTLLTGVFATADANNPLPVLISLDEAFYGPNQTRIPLKGSFVLGKAYGELTSQRALIQIVAISSVLPNGQAFENEQDLGYVTDEFGELGIKGELVHNTGRQLAVSFLGGFIAGGSQAMADSQVTTHRTLQGDLSKDVTGSSSKNAVFSGLAQSSGKLAEYYQKQAEEMVPAVHIRNGAKVFFIVQKGVLINGLSKHNFDPHRHLD